jgi:hypothetical protein
MAKKQEPTIKTKLTPQELIQKVEFYVKQDGMTYAEAIIEVCEQKELEPEDMAKLIKKGPLKNKLEVEAMNRNIIKNSTAKLY